MSVRSSCAHQAIPGRKGRDLEDGSDRLSGLLRWERCMRVQKSELACESI